MPPSWLAIVLGLGSLTAACAPACSSSDRDDGPERFYALDEIPTFSLRLVPDALDHLTGAPRDWVEATFEYRDQVFDDVEVRLKGHRSMRPLGQKASFKVRFGNKHRFLGLRRLTLNGMVEDPSLMREILGYRLYRAMGVAAPDVGYARVQINGEDYGLYALVETVDEAFLERRFEDASGGLYEGEYGCDLYPDDVPGFDKDAGKRGDRADLEILAAAAAGDIEALMYGDDALVDRDKVLAYLAVSTFIGDFDGYRHAHNYRLYHEPTTGRWSLVPWGIDRSFRQSLDVFDSNGLLARMCFANARCRIDYLMTLRQVVERFEELEMARAMEVLAALIDPLAAADPKRPHSTRRIRAERQRLLDYLQRRPQEIRDQTRCLDADGAEIDGDGDGFGCMDCADDDPSVHPGAAEVCDGRDNDCSGLIDDAPSCACTVVTVEGQGFHLCDLPMTWDDAAAFCRDKGLTLARIDSAAQSRQLRARADALDGGRWWLGLGDRADEGRFAWTDGTPATFAAWSRGEPDNAGCNQDCAALKEGPGGQWHDTHCAQPLPFVCRAP